MKNTDRLLKIGKRLEKEGLSSFKTATPGGAPAYFRSHGLQIIPSVYLSGHRDFRIHAGTAGHGSAHASPAAGDQ
jgi:hypothetical protein